MITPAFKHRCVQDLAWVIQSPAIISGLYNNTQWLSSNWWQNEYQACLPALLALDQNPTPLKAALSRLKTRRLGERFECFVEQWLSISPNYRCLTKNLALRSDKQTLGEIDFIIEEIASGKIIHLEVAIKFYLGIGDLNSAKNWYGPNLKDRLDIKLNSLTTHQTQLSRKYPELIPFNIDESWAMLKGRMFYPYNAQQHSKLFDAKHLSSHWCINTDAINHIKHLYPLAKIEWLADITTPPANTPAIPLIIQHPACYVEYKNQREQNRIFLLPESHWTDK